MLAHALCGDKPLPKGATREISKHGGHVLALIEFTLQNLSVVLHALDIACNRAFAICADIAANCVGVHVSISEYALVVEG